MVGADWKSSPGASSYTETSVYPAIGQPASRTTKLDSGAQKHLIWSPIEGHGPRPQASTRLARATVVPQASAQAITRTRTAGHCAGRTSPMGTFSKSAILHRFPNFYTLRVEIFRFFIRSCLPMTPMNHEKFHENRSARFWEIWKTHTHRQTDAATLYKYIYIYIIVIIVWLIQW